MSLPIEQMLKDVAIVEQSLRKVGSPCMSPVADLCCHVKALAAEVEEKELAINKLIAYACTCKKRNTPEWMACFAGIINAAIKAQGSDDSVRWPGSWANEFQLESGA